MASGLGKMSGKNARSKLTVPRWGYGQAGNGIGNVWVSIRQCVDGGVGVGKSPLNCLLLYHISASGEFWRVAKSRDMEVERDSARFPCCKNGHLQDPDFPCGAPHAAGF